MFCGVARVIVYHYVSCCIFSVNAELELVIISRDCEI
jgi:hypothetical protein